MTWREALHFGKKELLEGGVPNGDWDAEHLFLFGMKIDRTQLLLRGGDVLSEAEAQVYRELIEKRKNRVPLQYLTGEQEFMGLSFGINENVLIPRQDTECLVEAVLKALKERSWRSGVERAGRDDGLAKVRVLDLCTGSGCIGISIGRLAGKGGYPAEVVGSDISSGALDVAKRNALQNNVEITWIESDLFENISGKFHVIVSNPPYITKAEMEELMPEVRLFEPEKALYGMEDGLYFYRKIIRQAPEYLEENGMLFFEIGCSQGQAVLALMKEAGFRDIQIEKDLAGLNRIVYGRI